MTTGHWIMIILAMGQAGLVLIMAYVAFVQRSTKASIQAVRDEQVSLQTWLRTIERNKVGTDLCAERTGNMDATLKRIDARLTTICNGGLLGGLQADIVALKERATRSETRLDELNGQKCK